MRPYDILRLLRTQPFHPFRIHLSDGRVFEVRHPALAMVGRSTVTIGVPAADEEQPIFDRLVQCAWVHITHAGPIGGIASV